MISEDLKAVFIEILGGNERQYVRCYEESQARAVPNYGLTDAERLAIWIYTSTDGQWYERINGSLWKPFDSDPPVTVFARLVSDGLAKLPVFADTVYRGYRAHGLDVFVRKYSAGSAIIWPGFTSTTRVRAKAFSGNVLFRIESKTGRFLGPYADDPGEEEVLIPSGARFETLALDYGGPSAIIELRQIG